MWRVTLVKRFICVFKMKYFIALLLSTICVFRSSGIEPERLEESVYIANAYSIDITYQDSVRLYLCDKEIAFEPFSVPLYQLDTKSAVGRKIELLMDSCLNTRDCVPEGIWTCIVSEVDFLNTSVVINSNQKYSSFN